MSAPNLPSMPSDGSIYYSDYNRYRYNGVKKRWIAVKSDDDQIPRMVLNFENGVLDPRINFSRASNATVTRADGTIGYAPHNLLTFSEQFDNAAWSKTANITVTANTIAAPNGTLTADKLEVISTGPTSISTLATSAGNSIGNVFSTYLKIGNSANTFNYFALYNATTASILVAGNLNYSTGVFTYTTGSTGATVTNEGNGWWRLSLASTTGITTGNNIRCYVGNGGASNNAGDYFYIWGAQLEIGSTATTYNSTTVKNLLGYSELFDNAAWTKSNSCFVQTNLLTYSEAFDNAAWSKTTITATANSIVAPNGYQTADTLLATGANSTALQTFTASAVPYTFSVYLYRKTGTGNIDITVDGTTWVTKTITAGWTRVDTTLTPAAGSKTAGIRIATNGDEVYAWGAQLVQGSVAGDYRRTDAAALPVYYPNHNGVVCAEKLVENTANSTHGITEAYTAAIGTVVTFSCYMKAIDRNWARLTVNTVTGANASAYFNLSTGAVGSIGGGTASIVSAGNGWYRCSITGTLSTANPTLGIFLANADFGQTYTGDGTSGIYIFGAQLSDSASLDPYVLNAAAAPTAAAYYGARFDYDPVTKEPKGLLIEEQRTNLVLRSEEFDNASWAWGLTTVVSANTSTSPDGTQDADTLTASASNSIVRQFIQGLTNGATYTLSVWVKLSTATNIRLTVNNTTSWTGASSTKVTLTSTWQRITLTWTANGTQAYFMIGAVDATGTLDTSCYGNTLLWGAQLEAGAFATSYIPTAASQVTRAADVATIQGSNFYSWYNQNEGSIVTNAIANYGSAGVWAMLVALESGAASFVNTLLVRKTNNLTLNTFLDAAGANISLGGSTSAQGDTKVAISLKAANYAQCVNNGTVSTSATPSIMISSIIKIGIGSYNTGATHYLNGHIKSISYYPQRLSDSVLKGLTA